ncbi:LrgA family protein [Shewanella sediminis HAW-EB3]|uniref:LrgA family protein n=1 Tax=Shewanella sediminis (strain HAW-EB3) TaxID=425104 RepID=A8FRP0_SHESH|nr:LrgA family protein [Shewanella sediminis HAW-EB3]
MLTAERTKKCYGVLQLLIQIGLFCLLAWGMEQVSVYLELPVPGSVLGLAILLLLMGLKLVPEKSVKLGAGWLTGELLLFFIPPVISIIKYESLFEQYSAPLMLTLVIGSVCVLLGTGFVVDRVFRFETKMNSKRLNAAKAIEVI